MAYSEIDKINLFNKICKRIETGEALIKILKDENMPASETFFNWVDEDLEKTKQYARAMEMRADSIFEDIISISDATEKDVIKTTEGNEIVNHNVINRDRLRVDSRKWYLSKLMPKKYGDAVKIEHDGKLDVNTRIITTLTPEQLKESLKK